MASELRVNTLKDAAGSNEVAMEYVANGSAKAWIDIPSGQASINDSLNVSSLDDDGTGDGGINLTSSFGSVNYSIAMGVEDGAGSSAIRAHDLTRTTKVAGGYDFETFYLNASNDRTNVDMQSFSTMFGDLA
tara:strand:+ start:245 stop:640 length:396 start_codon:yes stop_codon:yes gene_type:complete